uniref:Uncharacterized protein n=1 Tax=Cyanoderma ruficeps TaxID=181631 RepID=A0A8C3RHL5_9PASS
MFKIKGFPRVGRFFSPIAFPQWGSDPGCRPWGGREPWAWQTCPAIKLVWTDCEGLCWNLAGQGLGEKPHADSYSAGQFSASFGSFTQPCTQWLHKADYKLQRIPEGAKSDAGANEPREPLIPVTEWDKLGKAWTTQIQGSPGSSKPALGTGDHYPLHSAGTQRRQRHVLRLGTSFPSRLGADPFHLASPLRSLHGCLSHPIPTETSRNTNAW